MTAFVSAALLLTAASATPVLKRQAATSCGGTNYDAGTVSSAEMAAYSYVSSNTEAGGSTYPHQYNDYEGFTFSNCQSPYYEFPLVQDGPYDGGAPGADRVIVDCTFFLSNLLSPLLIHDLVANGDYCGAITHTGASGDDFVACSGTS